MANRDSEYREHSENTAGGYTELEDSAQRGCERPSRVHSDAGGADYAQVIEQYHSSRHARAQRGTQRLDESASYRRAQERHERSLEEERRRAREEVEREREERELARERRAQARREREAEKAEHAREERRERSRKTRQRAADAWRQAHETAHAYDEEAEQERMERAAERRRKRDERIEKNRAWRKKNYEYVEEKDRSGLKVAVTFVLAAVAIAAAAVLFLDPFGISPLMKHGGAPAQDPTAMDASGRQAVDAEVALPTPIMAMSSGVQLHSAVAMNDLTEVLIHNASYAYAQEITTHLTEAKNEQVIASHGTGRDASAQPTGDEWMTGAFIRCFRAGNAGPKMSAIDNGAAPGTTVYSPVSGKVVLVKAYKLYEKYDDYQIHIQPEGHDNLDVVLIHLENPSVQAGDEVTGGQTPIAQIRDVYAYIGEEMQLKEYTAEGDNGNHTHIQVNDATDKDYHGLDDLKPAAEKKADAKED